MGPVIEPGSTWLEQRGSDNLFVVGRLKPGITKAQAEASLQALTKDFGKEYPAENAGRGLTLIPPGLFIPDIRNSVFAFAAVLTAVGALVLLLACVNLANLLLARATERRKEIAIRLAVGASRGRLDSAVADRKRDAVAHRRRIRRPAGRVDQSPGVHDQTADRLRAGLRSAHRLARPYFHAGALPPDRSRVQSVAGVAILQAGAGPRVKGRIRHGWLPPLAPAQHSRHRASRSLACAARERGTDRAQFAGSPTNAARFQPGKRRRPFLRHRSAGIRRGERTRVSKTGPRARQGAARHRVRRAHGQYSAQPQL